MTGLCGNFDLKTVNELRTPDNFELTNSQEFGNSWTAVEVHSKKNVFAGRFLAATSYSYLEWNKNLIPGSINQMGMQMEISVVLANMVIH